MKKMVTALMVVSLAGNIFPVINIVAISSLVPLYLISRDTEELKRSGYGPETAKKLLVVAYLYWLLSYALTGATLENLVSFDFLRFDGALFIASIHCLFAGSSGSFLRSCLWWRLSVWRNSLTGQ